MQGNFKSINQFRNFNATTGSRWFDKSSMKFYSTRLHSALYGNCVFVTSDNTYDKKRKYSVRVAMIDGGVYTYAFVNYDTRYEAHTEAKWLARALESGSMVWNSRKADFVSSTALAVFE